MVHRSFISYNPTKMPSIIHKTDVLVQLCKNGLLVHQNSILSQSLDLSVNFSRGMETSLDQQPVKGRNMTESGRRGGGCATEIKSIQTEERTHPLGPLSSKQRNEIVS